MSERTRCEWCLGHPLMTEYHDTEWGVPVHDDRKIFEFMVLDAAQAGLSWQTVLLKRENYRAALEGFDPVKIARYDRRHVARLLKNPGIIRNRLKVESTITNARQFLKTQAEYGTFDQYIWQFVAGKPLVGRHATTSPESDAMSKDLKARGFKFVGSTICYAFMQAAGMVNDHVESCFRYREVSQ